MKIAIVGAGAAGCFCAIHLKRMLPNATIDVFESGKKALAKVSITGGGRCNLTNSFKKVKSIQQVYPRGDKLMKRLLRQWSHTDTMQWFENEGVRLVIQEDECVFPHSQDAMQIVNTLLHAMKRSGVQLHLSHRVAGIHPHEGGYSISFSDPKLYEFQCDAVVMATGGATSLTKLDLLQETMVEFATPVPSLFTFCIPDEKMHSLMGTVVEQTTVSIAGTRYKADGPLLITHWGVSGPAILKLSAYAARHLSEQAYKGTLCINWLGELDEDAVRHLIGGLQHDYRNRNISHAYPNELTARHWEYLLKKCDISPTAKWSELGGKKFNRLCATLTSDTYPINGQSKYKEEFVTCGGVALESISMQTLESNNHPNLYFAGEVLDVDAVTGGFNLQAAWSMGYKVATSITKKNKQKECFS